MTVLEFIAIWLGLGGVAPALVILHWQVEFDGVYPIPWIPAWSLVLFGPIGALLVFVFVTVMQTIPVALGREPWC